MGIKVKKVKGHTPKKQRVKRFSDYVSIQAAKGIKAPCWICDKTDKVKWRVLINFPATRSFTCYVCDNRCKAMLLLRYT